MSIPFSKAFEKMPPQEKLQYVRSIQMPTNEEISFLISILTDPKENGMVQAAVLPALKNAGENASEALALCFSQTSAHENQMHGYGCQLRIKLSYALSQIPQTAAAVFESFLNDTVPEIRQNGVIGISGKNNGQYDSLLYGILIGDSDPKTAFEAASALEAGRERTFPLLKKILADDLRNVNKEAQTSGLDDHVLGKVIDIVGKNGRGENYKEIMMYIEPYLCHKNPNISNSAKEIIEAIKNEK